MHRWLNDAGRRLHLRQVEELRHQGTPARQARPAQSLNAARSKRSTAHFHAGSGGSASSRTRSASLIKLAEHLGRAAAPPDYRRQAREPQRRDGVVDEVVRQPVEHDDVRRHTRARLGADPCGIRMPRIAPEFPRVCSGFDDVLKAFARADRHHGCGQRARRRRVALLGGITPERLILSAQSRQSGRTPSTFHSQRPPSSAVARHQRVGFRRAPAARFVGRNGPRRFLRSTPRAPA